MIDMNQIGWSQYGGYEGPFFRGSIKFTTSSDPSEEEKVLSVITATESGRFDAINMYDRCILSAGLIQYCEAGQFSVSDMLGAIIEENDGTIPSPLELRLHECGAYFKKNERGRWRFFFADTRGEIDRIEEQRQLFLLHSTGKLGGFDDESKVWAKSWAVSIANTLQSEVARVAQIKFIAPRLTGFALKASKDYLWGDDSTPSQKSEDIVGAARAGFLSFAANLPETANKQVITYIGSNPPPKWSKEWLTGLMKQLMIGPNISIYPIRYNAIRPVIEKFYGVDLPDFADELRNQEIHNSANVSDYPTSSMNTTEEIQLALIKLGYDLGPAGADGKYGNKTRTAIMNFQLLQKLTPDGIVGPKTKSALYALTK